MNKQQQRQQEYMDRLREGNSIFIGDVNEINEDSEFINYLMSHFNWFNNKCGFVVLPKAI